MVVGDKEEAFRFIYWVKRAAAEEGFHPLLAAFALFSFIPSFLPPLPLPPLSLLFPLRTFSFLFPLVSYDSKERRRGAITIFFSSRVGFPPLSFSHGLTWIGDPAATESVVLRGLNSISPNNCSSRPHFLLCTTYSLSRFATSILTPTRKRELLRASFSCFCLHDPMNPSIHPSSYSFHSPSPYWHPFSLPRPIMCRGNRRRKEVMFGTTANPCVPRQLL